MPAIVCHHHWASPGGGQLVCASAAVALDSTGLEPILTSVFRFNPELYMKWYGINICKYKSKALIPFEVKAFGLWSRLYAWYPAKLAIDRFNASLIFTDEEAYKPLVNYRGVKIVEYMHFPFEVAINTNRGMGSVHEEDPYIVERYGRLFMRIYWNIFRKMLSHYLRENPFYDASLVLANSKWTADLVKVIYGERPVVLNPPIAPNTEVSTSTRPFEERRPYVVMLGRFSEEKRYHWVAQELAPKLIREVPGSRIFIFGGVTTQTQQNYMNEVIKLARSAGLRVSSNIEADADIIIISNAQRDIINKIMGSSRAFLHSTVNEHWGIAVAEAMARGLPAVVHKSGGTWTDLAEEGTAGLGYDDLDEAIDALARLITDKETWNHYSSEGIKRVRELTLDSFTKKLDSLIRRIL